MAKDETSKLHQSRTAAEESKPLSYNDSHLTPTTSNKHCPGIVVASHALRRKTSRSSRRPSMRSWALHNSALFTLPLKVSLLNDIFDNLDLTLSLDFWALLPPALDPEDPASPGDTASGCASQTLEVELHQQNL